MSLLAAIPERYLAGLRTVVLTNAGGLSRARRRQKTLSRNRKVGISCCLGLYHQAWCGEPASIELFVDNILGPYSRRLRRFPFLIEFAVGSVLYHEVGHHIHKTQAPEFRETEDVADKWMRKLMRHYIRRRHGWLAVFKPVVKSLQAIRKIARSLSRVTTRSRPG